MMKDVEFLSSGLRIPAAHMAKPYRHRAKRLRSKFSHPFEGRVGLPGFEEAQMFHVRTMTQPKRMAKALRTILSHRSIEIPLSTCQETVARMYGFATWHELGKADRSLQSPPDDECGNEEAVRRRAVQLSVLREGGIPEATAISVLDELKPTGRGGSDAASRFPRMMVRAVDHREDGTVVELPRQDLTEYMINQLASGGSKLVERDLEEGLPLHYVSSALDERTRAVAYAGRLGLPDLRERWAEFKERVGDVSDKRVVALLERRHSAARTAGWRLDSALATLARVRVARISTDPAEFEMFHEVEGYSSGQNEGYVHEPAAAYDGWSWSAFGRLHPMPEQGSPEREEWVKAYLAWSSDRVPHFVFGTTKVHWSGLDPACIRMEIADDGFESFHVESSIEGSLEEFHEDAWEEVVDADRIHAVVDEWEGHEGSGDEIDLAFDGKVREWNARQSVTTFFVDYGVVVPVGDGLDRARAVAWCEENIVRCRQAIADLDRWEVPRLEPMPATPNRRRYPPGA